MKKILLFVLIVLTKLSYGQEFSLNIVTVPDYLEFEGMVDSKYKINLLLYSDADRAFGNCYYPDSNKIFTLKGYIGIGNDFEEVNIIEYQQSNYWPAIYNNTPRAIFSGIIKNDTLKGERNDLINNQKMPFILIIKNLKNKISTNKYCIETKLDDRVFLNYFNTDTYYQCKPSIDYKCILRKGYDNYILMLASHFSKCAGYDSGNCGAGMEKFLIFQHINIETNIQMQQFIQYESCEKDLGSVIFIDDLYNSLNTGSDSIMTKFDINKFRSLRIDLSGQGKEFTYKLNPDSLDFGFNKTNKNYR